MSISARDVRSTANGYDPVLDEVIEEMANRLQAGEPVDAAAILAKYPDRADSIRRLLPAMEVMAEFGASASRLAAAGVSTDLSPLTSELGTLGDFRILREVGRGGMGIVYEADQVSLGRRVALKVLPFAGAMDSHQLRRFRTEAQAAAQLHHTNIVPVYWVGCENGVHYYAMQFIEGRTLADVIRELRHLEGKNRWDRVDGKCEATVDPAVSALALALTEEFHAPSAPEDLSRPVAVPATRIPSAVGTPAAPSSSTTRNRAYFRNVARLGVEAAEALAHAHHEGIVHRDVKPANLMVDARGNLWVTDFGLARLQGDSGLTITGDLLGTLRYMSPEQAAGRRAFLDHRTDIYSLGVTLYELLTLEPAFHCTDRARLLRRIADEDPRAPRMVDDSIPRELETIVLKAMVKEPEGRYQSAQDLADDLRRFLEDKPIRAKRPTVWERAIKLCRRHSGLVAAALFISLLIVSGLTTSLILIAREQAATRAALRRAIEQEKAARRNADEAEAQLRRADANFEWFLQGMTEPIKRMANPDLARNPEYAVMRREVISEAIRGYEMSLRARAGAPVAAGHRIATAIHIALLHTIADDHAQAQDAYRMAIQVAEALIDDEPGGQGWYYVGQTHAHLAMELWDTEKKTESEPHFCRATEAFGRALDLSPARLDILQSSAWFLSLFQDERFRDPPRALECARRLVAMTSEQDNRRSYSFGRRPLFTLGLAEYRMGNLDAARKALERSMELREGGDAYEWFVLSMVMARHGDMNRARELHREAVRWMRMYRYSDFELHALDGEAAALLDVAGAPRSSMSKQESAPQPSSPSAPSPLLSAAHGVEARDGTADRVREVAGLGRGHPAH
jgi:serine/threonine protein kinase